MPSELILNYNLPITGLPSSGEYARIELSESFDDFPTLTITSYTNSLSSVSIGKSIQAGPYTLVFESYTIEEPNTLLENSSLTGMYTLTETYVHPSKFILDVEINLKKYIDITYADTDKSVGTPPDTTEEEPDFILVKASSLIAYANKLAPVNAEVSISGDFQVKIPKKPDDEDTIVLSDLLQYYCALYQASYSFSGTTLIPVAIGSQKVEFNTKPLNTPSIAQGALPCYKDNVLTWDFELEKYLAEKDKKNTTDSDGSEDTEEDETEENENSGEDIPEGPKYIELEGGGTNIVYEGDPDPGSPPSYSATGKPRDISIMFDISGPTKSFKITQYKWGAPISAIEGTFGYAHAALELVDDPKKPYDNKAYSELMEALENIESGNLGKVVFPNVDANILGYPDSIDLANPFVWRLVKVVKTNYKYSPLKFKPNIQIKTKDGKFIKTEISDEELLEKATSSNIEVLIGEESSGWELKRFSTEDAKNFAEGSISAWLLLNQLEETGDNILGNNPTKEEIQNYNYARYSNKTKLESYLYRKVPYKAVTYYNIEPYSAYYKDVDKVSWRVEYIPKDKEAAKKPEWDGNNPDNLVAVVYPDPNWAPALMITGEVSCSSCVATQGNPNWNPWARTYYEMNSAIITTGSEEYRQTVYKVLPSENTVTKKDSTNIASILANAIADSNAIGTGTYYTPQPYMAVDSGQIEGISLADVNVYFDASVIANESATEDRYTVTTIQRTSGESFTSKLRNTTTSLQNGRPPSATIRKPQYKEVPVESGIDPSKGPDKPKDEDNSKVKDIEDPEKIYTINSSNVNAFNRLSDQNYTYSASLETAVACAKTELIKQAINTTTFTLTYPFTETKFQSKVNKTIALGGSEWLIKGSTTTVEIYQGKPIPQNLDLEVGLFYKNPKLEVTITEKKKEEEVIEEDVIIPTPEGTTTSVGSAPIELEDLVLDISLLDIPSKYSRWIE